MSWSTLPKWFAPPNGGYRGLGPNGEAVPRAGLPPKIPATQAGIARLQEQKGLASEKPA